MKTYDPKKVIVIFGGHEITGFSEDSIVTVEPKGDGITSVSGCDGEVTRNMDPNEQYTVTLKLQQSSSSNNFLSSLHDYDRRTGRGIKPLLVKDLSGSLVFSTQHAWIINKPSVEKGKESGDNEWKLETGRADFVVGGNY